MRTPSTILLADDESVNLTLLSELCRNLGYTCLEAHNGLELVRLARQEHPDLVITDVVMPELDGFSATEQLKRDPTTTDIPVIIVTAKDSRADRLTGIGKGASDFLTKPFDIQELSLRAENCLKMKQYQDLLKDNASLLEQKVAERTNQLEGALLKVDEAYSRIKQGYLDTIYRLMMAAEYKDGNTGGHIRRSSHYAKLVAEELGLDSGFVNAIFYAAPMHDLGKVGVPDALLSKPGELDDDEWRVIRTHTTIGASILQGSDSEFLKMAETIALTHHERWDGQGYPNRIKGDRIPLAGRIVSLGDQYDALRMERPYKGRLSHEQAITIILHGDVRTRPEHFDPDMLRVFERCNDRFREIFDTYNAGLNTSSELRP